MVDFKKAISEYYEREINIIKNLNLDELNESMNAILDTYNNGYNATKGGDTADGRDALKGQDHPFAKLTQKEVE